MKKSILRTAALLLSVGMLISLMACGPKESDPTDPDTQPSGTAAGGETNPKEDTALENISYATYLTTPTEYIRFVRQDPADTKFYPAVQLDENTGLIVHVDTGNVHQTIEGWGASITEASAINLWNMPEDIRNEVMKKLFSPDDGIGMTILRQPIGISDFSDDPNFSYAPVADDLTLEHFTLGKHSEMILPLIRQAVELSESEDDFKVFLTAWTAPLWMKTDPTRFDSIEKNTLKREYYGLYADYLVKAVQAYLEEGAPVYSLSPQNEFTGVHGIAAMYMSVDSMASFINMYLKPALDEAGLDTKILAWDFNFFQESTEIISKAYDSIGGVAYHAYGGNYDYFYQNIELFPDLPFYMTESAGAVGGTGKQFFSQFARLLDFTRAGARTYILWNIVLDEERGPFLEAIDGGDMNPIGLGMLEWNREEQKVAYLEDYYALGHFSKFIRPGAVVLESTDLNTDGKGVIQNLVCRNKSGTMTAVLMNNTTEAQTFKLVVDDYVVEYTVPAKSAATVTWNPNA